MATKTLHLNSTGTKVISNSNCSYGNDTITTNTLKGNTSATLQWLFYLSDICGSEDVTINSIKVTYQVSSNRNSSFYNEGTARTGYLISGVANSKYSDKTIARDKTGNSEVYTDVPVTFNSSFDSWAGSHLFTHNGKKAAGIFISLINNASVNFEFDVKNLSIVIDYTPNAVNKILIGETKATAIYLDETSKTITFVASGTITDSGSAGADTVDDYHIKISNSAPSSGALVSAVYIDETKVYG